LEIIDFKGKDYKVFLKLGFNINKLRGNYKRKNNNIKLDKINFKDKIRYNNILVLKK